MGSPCNGPSYLLNHCLLKKEMATHSSILAWRIPWTEELGRLQFMGSQRFEHDCVTNHHHHHHYLMRAYEMSIINDPWLLERPRLFALQALSFSGHSDIAKKKKPTTGTQSTRTWARISPREAAKLSLSTCPHLLPPLVTLLLLPPEI